MAAILWFVDLSEVIAAISRADARLLLAALGLSLVWLGVRALVWRTLLAGRASYRSVFLTMCEGYLLNNFLPFRLGEIGRAFLLSRKSGLRFTEVLPTVVVERVFDLGLSAAVLLLSLPFVVGTGGAVQIAALVGSLVLAGLGVLFLIVRNRHKALDIFHRLSARWPSIQRLGGELLESFFAGLGVLDSSSLFLRFIALITLNWAIAVIQYTIIIAAFFPQAEVPWGMFALGAAAFGGAIPSLPGAVGTFESAYGGALALLSGDQSTALAVALTTRVYNYLGSGIFGIYALTQEGQTLSGLYHQLINMRMKTETGEAPVSKE